MAKLIGIAGKIGAGKNAAAAILESCGWRTLDLDDLAHQILDTVSDDMAARFGTSVMQPDGKVDRQALGAIVFRDEQNLLALEEMLYPQIARETRQWLTENPSIPAAIHAVNLHKTELPELCDAIIWIDAPQWIRRRRVCRRDGRPWKILKQRFERQKSLNPKLFLSRAETYIVRNSGNFRTLQRRLEKIPVL